jgi:hypothetical protein
MNSSLKYAHLAKKYLELACWWRNARIHDFNLFLVLVSRLWALQFKRGSQQFIVYRKGLTLQMNRLGDFKSKQSTFHGHSFDFCYQKDLHFVTLADGTQWCLGQGRIF